jgi:(2Fe-2S) ferredoxin
MYWTERHVFVCTGNHCSQKGANQVLTRLRFELMRRRLTTKVLLNNCGTIDLCDIGPNVIVYPDNIVYSNVTENDIPDLVAFLEGGPVVERLLTNAHAPAEQNRQAFFAALRDRGNSVPAGEATSLAAAQGLDERWIAEQLKRGFMAKKPDAESGEDRLSMTSKALHRYRL